MVYLLVRNVILLQLFAFLVGVFLVPNKLYYLFGLMLGGCVTLAKIFLMEEVFKRSLKKAPSAATSFVRANYMLWYVINFIILFIGVSIPAFNFVGVVIGLLLLKPAAYIQGKLEPSVPKDGSVEFLEWEEPSEDEKSDFW
jgi:hypothetical protein